MKLKTYTAETMAQALAQVRKDLGKDAMILHTRSYRVGSWLGLGGKNMVEITASSPAQAPKPRTQRPAPQVQAAPQRASAEQEPEIVVRRGRTLTRQRLGASSEPDRASVMTSAPPAEKHEDDRGLNGRDALFGDEPPRAPRSSSPEPRLQRPPKVDREPSTAPKVPAQPKPKPEPTQSHKDENAELRAQLESMQKMMGQVLESTRKTAVAVNTGTGSSTLPSGEMPAPLFDLYKKMMDNDVSAEMADHLVGAVRDRLDKSELHDPIVVRQAMLREIEQTIREQSLNGSLAGVFLASPVGTRCVMHTPMGKRLVRSWLSAPLIDRDAINARLDAVESLTLSSDLRDDLSGVLGSMCDMARIAGRIALGRATPRDLVALGGASVLIEELMGAIERCESLKAHHESLSQIRDEVLPLGQEITRCCTKDAPAHLREGGLINDGIDPQLDEARGLQRDAGTWLSEYQQRIIEEHELPSLKVGYNKVFGFYIELPAAQARRAPDVFTRKQTLKNAERYITPELKEYEEKVLSAGDRANERERVLFDQLCEQARSHLEALGTFSDIVATIDCLLGFALKASQRGWVRPKVVEAPTLEITDGRHPVLDETLGHDFVPNGCTLAQEHSPASLALITGPNMAGKSTYIRQNALLVVLAQAGSFVPAAGATVGIATRIFTRVGADDALHRGQSTFMVEMIETANILNHADERSLVILDEIGRGTSTLDGLSLAWAISEWLAEHQPRTLFATHYHEITELESKLKGQVKNLHVAVREWTSEDGNQEIAFLHSIRAGRADQSYGIHVAQLAGVPKQVTQRAKSVLESLSVEHAGRVDTKQVQAANKASASSQMSLFTEFVQHPVVDSLREIKLEEMTPMQAFDALRDMKNELGKE
ncbi:MAG: DNA mismatch repair protein MutS [bacterium]|nr:DNA mismatch repair protein MutS [bacterium]